MARRGKRFTLVAALALWMTASLGNAQTRPAASAVILGTIGDSALHPIPSADVAFAGSRVRVASDSLGRFRVIRVPAGQHVLIVRALGYLPATSLLDVADADTLRLAFTLEPVVHEIAGVTVTDRKLSPKLQDFDARRKLGFGEFFTQAVIEAMNPLAIGDVLRRAKSVKLSPSGKGVLSAREFIACPSALYLDGIPVAANSLDYMPSPREIAAIEVYGGAATLPLWLPQESAGTKKGCGAVLVWTRDGS